MHLDSTYYHPSCQLGHNGDSNILGWQRITTEVSEMPQELGEK